MEYKNGGPGVKETRAGGWGEGETRARRGLAAGDGVDFDAGAEGEGGDLVADAGGLVGGEDHARGVL